MILVCDPGIITTHERIMGKNKMEKYETPSDSIQISKWKRVKKGNYGNIKELTRKQSEIVHKGINQKIGCDWAFDHYSRDDKKVFYSEPYVSSLCFKRISNLQKFCDDNGLKFEIFPWISTWYPNWTILIKFEIIDQQN